MKKMRRADGSRKIKLEKTQLVKKSLIKMYIGIVLCAAMIFKNDYK